MQEKKQHGRHCTKQTKWQNDHKLNQLAVLAKQTERKLKTGNKNTEKSLRLLAVTALSANMITARQVERITFD